MTRALPPAAELDTGLPADGEEAAAAAAPAEGEEVEPAEPDPLEGCEDVDMLYAGAQEAMAAGEMARAMALSQRALAAEAR